MAAEPTPETNRALILRSHDEPLTLTTHPLPAPVAGSITIRVLSVPLVPYMTKILQHHLPYPLVLPLVPGASCIGRVAVPGPDAARLKPGHLVFFDPSIRARDDPHGTRILMGLHAGVTPQSTSLMAGEWRDGSFAQFVKAPLENVYPLAESLLEKYTVDELAVIPVLLAPYGGFADAGVRVGDSVLVMPATGKFGGAAVVVARALGARVVAAGRNEEALKGMKGRFPDIETVVLTGNEEDDERAVRAASSGGKGVDCYIDWSPPAAAGSSGHIGVGVKCLRVGGTAVLMGGIMGGAQIPYGVVMSRNLVVRGRFMYERCQVEQFIRMVECGALKLGAEIGVTGVKAFGLEEHGEGLKEAEKATRWGDLVVLKP